MKKLMLACLVFVAGCGGAPARPPVVTPPSPVQQVGYLAVWVTDARTGQPIDGATVTTVMHAPGVFGVAQSASTNADGWSGGPATFGHYAVRVRAERYEDASVETDVAGHTDVRIALARVVPPTLPVRVAGRFWVTDAGTFRPLFQSGLTLLVRAPPERAAFLDQTAALGFNGLRVFAGALAWAPQTVEQARAALPALLEEAAARGLYVYAVAVTDSGQGYDAEAHLRAVAAICARYTNCLLEAANEIGHPTQSARVNDIGWLLSTARRVISPGVVWALGSVSDEPEPDGTVRAGGGSFVTGHLDRGRDLYNQVRRLREIEALSAAARTPAMSGEPIGIAEVPMPGKQRFWNSGEHQQASGAFRDAATRFAFTYGALCRGFEVGCVFHSEQGLRAELLGPNTAGAARAFIEGWRAFDTSDRLTFANAGWAGSPVVSARFSDKFPPPNVVRAYSFVTGDRGWTVLVGTTTDAAIDVATWGNGWRPERTAAARPGVRIVEIRR